LEVTGDGAGAGLNVGGTARDGAAANTGAGAGAGTKQGAELQGIPDDTTGQ